jgi:hypothetical protein
MRGSAYLGGSTHLVATALFASVGLVSVYVWIRLTAGNLAMALLLFAYRRGERALAPEPVVEETGAAEAVPGALPVEAPPPPEPRKEPAPISFHPPPLDE